jgi:hypothetical protein
MPNLSSTSAAGEAAARPKIMRRPPQFSSPTNVIINQEPALNLPSLTQPEVVPLPWQDDGRFAIALVFLLVVINVLAVAWLVPSTPVAKSTFTTTQKAATPVVTILNELNPPESYQ